MSVGIVATGRYVPEGVMSNLAVAELADTSVDWIIGATQMNERRYAADNQATSDMAIAAVKDLIERTPDALEGVRAVIVATSTPDKPQPATAAIVLEALGLKDAFAFDMNAVCAGSLFAIEVGAGIVRAGGPRARVLVIGADRYSGILDRSDKRTLSILGDGAGAVVLSRVPDGYGILHSCHITHGEFQDAVQVRAGGTRLPLTAEGIQAGDQYFRMDGRAVRAYVDANLPPLVLRVVKESGLSIQDISRFVFHQANPKLLRLLASTLQVEAERVPITADWYGNSGAASMLVTLAESTSCSVVERGEHLVLAAVGGGLSTGVMTLKWF